MTEIQNQTMYREWEALEYSVLTKKNSLRGNTGEKSERCNRITMDIFRENVIQAEVKSVSAMS